MPGGAARRAGGGGVGRGEAVVGGAQLIEGTAPGGRLAVAALDWVAGELAGRSPRAAADLALRALQLTDAADEDRCARAVTAVDALIAAKRIAEATRLAGATLALLRLPPVVEAELRLTRAAVTLVGGQPGLAAAEACSVLATAALPAAKRDAAELTRIVGWLASANLPTAQATAEAILAGRDHPGGAAALAGAGAAPASVAWGRG